MNIDYNNMNVLIINDDLTETALIKSFLDKNMRAPLRMLHCVNLEEAHACISKVDLVILKPEMSGELPAKDVFKNIYKMVFETPIIVITDENSAPASLSNFVMNNGAADTIIRGEFTRLVDAIEFAFIRQQITTDTRKSSDKTLQDSKDEGDKKSQEHDDRRLRDLMDHQQSLSMFMGGYSASNQFPKAPFNKEPNKAKI